MRLIRAVHEMIANGTAMWWANSVLKLGLRTEFALGQRFVNVLRRVMQDGVLPPVAN